jgi:cobalt/nickel transport system permease protein
VHLPDGILAPAVWAPLAALTSTAVLGASARARRLAAPRGVAAPAAAPAVLAAFVFAAQAFQFPIPGGASGHLLGGTLLAVLLGPARAIVAMASVYATQAILFQDGGIAALGANIWNGGIVPVLLGFGIAEAGGRLFGERGRRAGAGIGAFVGVLAGASLCAAEVGLSGSVPVAPFLAAMLGVHVWIALGEALITASLVRVLTPRALRWDSPAAAPARRRVAARTWIAAAAITAVVVASQFLSSRASDGLESSARRLGLAMDGPPAEPPASLALFLASAGGALVCALLVLAILARARSRSK